MLDLQFGDRIELSYEDAPATTIRATVDRLLSDRNEGMGIEVEELLSGGSRSPWMSRVVWIPIRWSCSAQTFSIGSTAAW